MTHRQTRTTFPFRPNKPDTMEWVKQQAEQIDRSANWFINNLIEQAKHQQETQCKKP
ncbi:hypothetical protein [Lampropedia aestuarii]|uniref:hypothetical protein n=1 Tax=Lampropedia aestuarii TaxID=2562762 RepID=UPI0014561637|nr:hypothetical protein [Lampropedia aestuarii]